MFQFLIGSLVILKTTTVFVACQALYGLIFIRKEKKTMKKYQETVVRGMRFAIFLDEKNMTAHEAVWTGCRWEHDPCYLSIGVDSFDVAGSLDFDAVRKMGYQF